MTTLNLVRTYTSATACSSQSHLPAEPIEAPLHPILLSPHRQRGQEGRTVRRFLRWHPRAPIRLAVQSNVIDPLVLRPTQEGASLRWERSSTAGAEARVPYRTAQRPARGSCPAVTSDVAPSARNSRLVSYLPALRFDVVDANSGTRKPLSPHAYRMWSAPLPRTAWAWRLRAHKRWLKRLHVISCRCGNFETTCEPSQQSKERWGTHKKKAVVPTALPPTNRATTATERSLIRSKRWIPSSGECTRLTAP